jgi:methylase of polypeptide subunit release factors
MQHQICKMTLHGRLHLAPLKKDKLNHVLDFGTGTGIWAIEFGMRPHINLDNHTENIQHSNIPTPK